MLAEWTHSPLMSGPGGGRGRRIVNPSSSLAIELRKGQSRMQDMPPQQRASEMDEQAKALARVQSLDPHGRVRADSSDLRMHTHGQSMVAQVCCNPSYFMRTIDSRLGNLVKRGGARVA